MKYAVRYYKDSSALKKADEIILRYDDRHEPEDLLEHLDNYKSIPRIILDISDYKDEDILLLDNLDTWVAAKEYYNNIAIRLDYSQRDIVPYLHKENIDYFFSNRVDTIDIINNFIYLGVSDIYICNELGFSLGKIADYIHECGVNIRVYPNVAQTSADKNFGAGIKTFFIRPDDTVFYEPYVDIFEFFGDTSKHAVLYDIYKSEEWLGDLNEIITDLNMSLTNVSILPDFAETRLNCDKKCGYNGRCVMCDRILDFLEITDEIREQSGGLQFTIEGEKSGFKEIIKND